MKRITRRRYKGSFVSRRHRKMIEFDEMIIINKDIDELIQIKKHLDKKYKTNLKLEWLPNGKDFIINNLE